MKTLQLFILFLLFGFMASAQENIFTGKIGFTLHDMEVLHMPEYFRNVPIHPQDGGGENKATISKYSYQNYLVLPIFSFEYTHKFKNNIGIGGGLNIEISWSNRQEINYNDSIGYAPSRGFGTALTFSGTINRGMFSLLSCTQTDDPKTIPTSINLSMTPYIFISFPVKEDIDIKLLVTYQRYAAVNGWDRYNTLEYYQKKTLAYIIPIDILFRIKWAELGPRIPIVFKTDDGREFDTKVFPIGLVFNYRIEDTD